MQAVGWTPKFDIMIWNLQLSFRRAEACGPRPAFPPVSRRISRVLLVLATLVVPALALDPTKAVTQYRLDTWHARDGLPQDSVRAIATLLKQQLQWEGSRPPVTLRRGCDGVCHVMEAS